MLPRGQNILQNKRMPVAGEVVQVEVVSSEHLHLGYLGGGHGEDNEAVVGAGFGFYQVMEQFFEFGQVGAFQRAQIYGQVDAFQAEFENFLSEFGAQRVAFDVVTDQGGH